MTPSPSSIELKDSGIPWVGFVPSTWDMKRAKFLFSLAQRPPQPDDGIVTAFRDGQVTLRSNRRTDGFTNALKETGYQRVHKGDLVIHAMDAFAGAIGVSDSDGKCTPVYSCCVPSNEASSEFYARCVRTMSTTGFIESLSKGIRERSTDFRWATFAEQILPHPPKAEQDAIVAHLDCATSRIDALVAKKTRFIELLREKRQALITHAVTKGLDTSVPMKDSGVEWLGEIPEHWKSMMLRRAVSSFQQGWSPDCEGRRAGVDEWGVTKSGCVNGGVFREDENKALPSRFEPKRSLEILDGDVLMSRASGSPSLIGSAAYVSNPRRGLLISDKIFRLLPTAQTDPRFLVYSLGSTPLRRQIEQAIGGAEGLANNLSQQSIKELWLAQPPLEEQTEIVSHLDRATSRIDTLIAKTEHSIELLREHRTALITAAVTGKIDLRN